ncbi:hypothetical protein SERLA73DRAFT_192111 [Serpula lacrymans var. lacrymans S7.3]|uniref:Uncharacterized protein n=1 Tax=Serpula lacrymans var. lacrymans (strain S7.3) TaxID=936435 RepID=F8QJ10_SERL3|nr:hypothetical protein SERLA73DRAFT_192111 [Serpula lacrymans var. lacrymans S7.3]
MSEPSWFEKCNTMPVASMTTADGAIERTESIISIAIPSRSAQKPRSTPEAWGRIGPRRIRSGPTTRAVTTTTPP